MGVEEAARDLRYAFLEETAAGLPGEAFEQALSSFDGLSPFLDAVKKYFPLFHREKPRKLLEALAVDAGVKGRAVEQLWNAAVFFDTMPAFLSALRMGEEGDITRLNGGRPSFLRFLFTSLQ